MAIVPIKGSNPLTPDRPEAAQSRMRAKVPDTDTDTDTDTGPDTDARLVNGPAGIPPPRRIRKKVDSAPAVPVAAPAEAAPTKPDAQPRRRGEAYKDENGKWHAPVGNKKGFCCPPEEHRFKGKPGPGRPKGSRSQASILRQELNHKVGVTIDGVHRKVTKRELAARLMVKTALEKQVYKELTQLNETSERLFPEQTKDETASSPLGDAVFDEGLIALLLEGLALGEPDPDGPDPAEAEIAADGDPDGGPDRSLDGDDAWEEGDWSDPGALSCDDDDDHVGANGEGDDEDE